MSPDWKALREQDADPDPFRQFDAWFRAAGAAVAAPEAMAVATASADGAPSVRMVLLKSSGPGGFVFFSNYASRKGRDLSANPRAALLFHWDPLGRQVRIEGAVHRTSEQETADYVRSRPRGSQLSALASPQSRTIEGRETLEHRVAELAGLHPQGELPLPANWGGYRVVPVTFEFWQQREDRLHDRLRYVRDDGEHWVIDRLAP